MKRKYGNSIQRILSCFIAFIMIFSIVMPAFGYTAQGQVNIVRS